MLKMEVFSFEDTNKIMFVTAGKLLCLVRSNLQVLIGVFL